MIHIIFGLLSMVLHKTSGAVANVDPNKVYYYISPESLSVLEKARGVQMSTRDLQTTFASVKYQLWTPENGVRSFLEFNNSVTSKQLLIDFKFNPERSTNIICHGWRANGKTFTTPFVKAYYSVPSNVNIMSVDYSGIWEWYIDYLSAARNIDELGVYVGTFFSKLLLNEMGQKAEKIHVIGHSLGAHLAGHIGRTLGSSADTKIRRVTAIDPAGPYFSITSSSNRVQKSDAKFVQVIHTNSGSLLLGRLSLEDQLGHVDFYPNGGSRQPGCDDKLCMGTFCLTSSLIELLKGACSHSRGLDYYVESIKGLPKTKSFLSIGCDGWKNFISQNCSKNGSQLPMGEPMSDIVGVSDGAEDFKFYLSTNEKYPFSKS